MIELAVNNSTSLRYASIELPNPVFENTVGVDAGVDLKRTQDGTLYSYIKSSDGRFTIVMRFARVGYGKTRSVSDFFRAIAGNTFDLTDHDDVLWNVRFDQEVFDFTVDGRMGPEVTSREHCSFELRFIGKKV